MCIWSILKEARGGHEERKKGNHNLWAAADEFYTVGYYIHTKLGIFQAQQRGFRSESRSYIDSSVPDKEPIWGVEVLYLL